MMTTGNHWAQKAGQHSRRHRIPLIGILGLIIALVAATVAPMALAGTKGKAKGYDKKSPSSIESVLESTLDSFIDLPPGQASTTTTTLPLTQDAEGNVVVDVEKLGADGIGARFETLEDDFKLNKAPGTSYDVALRTGLLSIESSLDAAQPADARVAAGHDRNAYGGAGVQIALIDTGVADVPGLRNSNVVVGPDFSFDDRFPELRGIDANGHGSFLAGLMVGSDEAWLRGDRDRTPERVLGIAPDAGLVSVKVGAKDGAVDVTQVIAAIDWVIEHRNDPGYNIRIINLSYGTDSVQDYQADPLAYAVERAWKAGIVVVVAAGNDGEARVANPAIDPYVIAVGAAENHRRNKLRVADFSNYGSATRPVDIFAPGQSLVGLRVAGAYADAYNGTSRVGGELVRATGSSQAAAVVSASVALLLEQRPHLTPDQVKHLLITNAPTDNKDSRAPSFLAVDRAMAAPTPHYGHSQGYAPATGTGSIDLSRGSSRITLDGVPLTGEIDIFGNSWTGNSWTTNSWTGNSWTGNSWS